MKGDRWEDPKHFPTPAAFRKWFEKNHDRRTELWVGFYRKGHGQGLTYPEAVDESLCFGWIDGIKRKVDDVRYTNRFTPRKPDSKWSRVNLRRFEELSAQGRVAPPGAEARARFDPDKHGAYSFERDRPARLAPELERRFKANAGAWAFFKAQPAGYRRLSIHWIMSAKRDETRLRRLERIIEFSEAGERLPQISGRAAKKPRDT
jgi:uncharacterized protein YdeI (YjbR/CyaY-like superfamily)